MADWPEGFVPDTQQNIGSVQPEGIVNLFKKYASAAGDEVRGGLKEFTHNLTLPTRFLDALMQKTGAAEPGAPGLTPTAESVASAIVPQTATDLGVMLGTMGSGGVLSRLLKPAVLGAGSALLSGDDVGTGATKGAFAGGLGAVANYLRPHLPGIGQAQTDLRNIGTAVGDVSPELGRVVGNKPTVPGIQAAVTPGGAGDKALIQPLAEAEAAITSTLNRLPPNIDPRIRVPALFGEQPVEFQQAVDAMRALGPGGFTPGGLAKETMSAADYQALKAAATQQIVEGLNGLQRGLGDVFRVGQQQYAQGAMVQDLFNKFRPGTATNPSPMLENTINVPELQRAYQAQQGHIENVLGVNNPLRNAIYRGAAPGQVDVARGAFPVRNYAGGPFSEGFRIPLPTSFIGQTVQVPPIAGALATQNLFGGPYRR